MKNTAIALILILFCQQLYSETEALKYAICRLGRDVRTIRVIKSYDVDRSCETVYSKKGKDKTVGWGVNVESCVDFYKRIKDNLDASSWQCKEVDNFSLDSAE